MATSGTHNFTLDIADIAEEAFERAGGEMRTGYDLRTARRSLDLMLLDWQNRGLNLWTVSSVSLPLVAGQATYDLSGEKLDVLDALLRTDEGTSSQLDLYMERISVNDYARQTDKRSQGRPLQYYVQQGSSGLTLHLWPVPDSSAYTLTYYFMERIEDAGTPASNTLDVPVRFLPCLTAGLAYHIGLKKKFDPSRLPMLQADYENQFMLATEAAREKASFFVRPGGYS